MVTNKSYYIQVLEDVYQAKLRKNPSFSLRAYARFLGLAPQVLSEILRGKRHLPVKYLHQILEKLCLSPKVEKLFFDSLKSTKARLKDIAKLSQKNEHILCDERNFNIIAEWEYYAVITFARDSK